MALSRQEKLGLVGLIVLFVLFAVALVLTVRPVGNKEGGTAEDSFFVQQRIQNIQKSE